MKNVIEVLKIGSAFIGIIVGAGFASGQEILQYFTSFGYMGIAAAIISTALFAYLGMTLTRLGSRVQAASHRGVIYKISGKYLGPIVDGVIIFTLFGTAVVMIAGAGSILHQQFNLPPFVGSLLLVILAVITVMLNVDKVIAVIGSITPFLILAIILIGAYSMFTMDTSLAELEPFAKEQTSAVSSWWLAGINYASFNVTFGAAMTLVMGGSIKNEKTAALGGLVGGLVLGVLIMLSHFAIFSKVDQIAHVDMPMLQIVTDISPSLSIFMTIILFGMIFNTGVSMIYSFVARFVDMNTKKANTFTIVTALAAFGASFAGFTVLVNWFYPVVGYLGFFLIAALIIAPFRIPKRPEGSEKTTAA